MSPDSGGTWGCTTLKRVRPITEPTKRDGSGGRQVWVEPLKILTRPE
jgi:hypothetical protein